MKRFVEWLKKADSDQLEKMIDLIDDIEYTELVVLLEKRISILHPD